MTDLSDALPLILGAGGAAFIASVAQAVNGWRNGAEQREARAVGNLERWRREADQRAERALWEVECERKWGSYWRQWAGTLEYTMAVSGIPLPPRPPEPSQGHGPPPGPTASDE